MKKIFLIPILIIVAFFVWSPKAEAAANIAVSSAKYTSSSTILVTFTATGSNLATSTAYLWHVGDAGLTPSSSTISSATSTQTMTLIFSGTPFADTGTSSTAAHGLYVDALGVTDAEGDTNTVLILGTSKAVSDSQLPTLSAVTIASNNANAAKAKVGDVVTITFTASEKLNTNTVSATSTSGTTLNWTERRPIGDTNGYLRVVSDADGSNLIAGGYSSGSSGRLYTSSDYGVTWTERQPAGGVDKNWVVASDADGSNLMAGVYNDGRLYISSDYGVTWTERTPTGTAEDKSWFVIASDADGSNLVIGAYPGRLYTSSDYGVTWTERYPPGGTAEDKNWYGAASDVDGSNLIIEVTGGRLYTSSDYGVTWTERYPPGGTATDKTWRFPASDADGSNLIIGVSGGRLYTSSDYGVTWTERYPPGGTATDKTWRSVTSDSDGSDLTASVSTSGRFYISSDYGVTWTESTPTGTAEDKNWNNSSSDFDGSNLVAAVNGGRVYTSSYTHLLTSVATSTSDGGTTWTATTTVTWVDTDGAIGFDILFSDVAGNAGEGVFATTDSSSVTFDKTAPTLTSVSIVSNNSNTSVAKVGGTVTISFTASEALSTTNTLSVAFSSGATPTWTERATSTNPAIDANWQSVVSDSDGSNLFAAIRNGRLYTSANGGVTWTERTPTGSAEDKSWYNIASDADGSNLMAVVNSGRIYTSSDSGVTWTERRPTGVAENTSWWGIASDADGSNLIASIFGGRLYTSSDGGVTWTERTPTGSAENKDWYMIASDADGSNLVAAVNSGRFYTSADSGATWTERAPTGVAGDKVWRVVSSDADGSNLTVGINGGRFYVSQNGGVTWTERTPTGTAEDKLWRSAALDADGSNLVVVVYGGRVYNSSDSGVTWTERTPTGTAEDKNWYSVASDADGSNFVAAAYGGRLYTASTTLVAATVATSTSDGGTTWTATYTANAADVQGPIQFAINFQDLAGNVSVVSDTTNSSAVTLYGPLAPTGLSVLGTGLGIVSLSWNATAGTTSYKIYRSATDSGFTTLAGTSTATTFSDASAGYGVTNYYKVSAVNATGEGPQSTLSVNALTQSPPTGGGSSGPVVAPPVTPPATPPAVITTAHSMDPNTTGTYSASSASLSTPTLQIDLNIVQLSVTSTLCIPETLIKSVSNSSVYYCGGDGLRYVFANESVYFTWFKDFLNVKVLTDAELAAIPMGRKLITYRPGIRMIKIQTDPRVYAVARGGILRWIRDEATAKLLYGNNWNIQIDDVSDALFTSYTIGEPVE